jgi:hypothetical protein
MFYRYEARQLSLADIKNIVNLYFMQKIFFHSVVVSTVCMIYIFVTNISVIFCI